MKLYSATILSWAALFSGHGAAQFTWPSPYDELEDVMFLNTGYRSRGFSAPVTPCSFSAEGPGRQAAAEWLRAGFHDMATTNIFFAPHGGIDASLAFELNDGENLGAGFSTTFITYGGFYNSRLSASDLVALGVYASVRSCGGPIIPMRGGRVDATGAGPLGVPQPQNGAGTFSNQFARMGFNVTDMIRMTACGHTLGGVHAGDFPQIVVPGTVANDFQLFDSTEGWDNKIATRYVNGPDTDPLSVGISVSSGRNSDAAVFNADRNVTITSMSDPNSFNNQCVSILQRMIEVVDPSIVTLSSIIQPYEVKPAGLQLTLLSGGTQLAFSGNIRVRTTVRSASQIASVQLIYKDRTGGSTCGACTINAAAVGTASGFDDSFSFYSFSSNIPIISSISSFTVLITLISGTTQAYNNNGNGFPMSDSVLVQTPQSCLNNGKLTVVAAVRSTTTTPINMTITQKISSNSGSPIPSPLPSLTSSSILMAQGAAVGPYNLYSASYSIASAAGTKYGVSSGTFSDTFKDPADLGTTCAAAPPVASSSTNTSTSATPTPTLAHKPKVGIYSFQGCYTEGTNIRALSGNSFYNYTGLTLEQCAGECSGFNYWGVEYGGECYCGNTINAGSVNTTLSDCSFVCPGNSYEYCGAGNRLEMYLLTFLVSTSSGVVSSTTSITSSSTVVSTTSSSSTKSSTVVSSTSTSTSTSSTSSVSSSTTASSSGVSTSSSSSASASPTLGITKNVDAYTFQGCYTEGTNVRALSGNSFYDYTAMKLEVCAVDCAAYKFWGVEYGGECYCGNAINAGSVNTTLSDCSFTCPGNRYEYCGAGNRLQMYMLSSLISSSSGSSIAPTSSSSSTSSSKTSTSSSSSKVTSTLSSTSTTSSSSSTSSSSTKSTTSTSTTSSSSSSTSSKNTSTSATSVQTAPAIKTKIASYTYYGCRTEGDNVRALSSAVFFNYTGMTLEQCASDCNGYTLWGVEYGGECYCGNSWNTGSVNASQSDCSFTCPGDRLEWCGAGNRLSAYYLAPKA